MAELEQVSLLIIGPVESVQKDSCVQLCPRRGKFWEGPLKRPDSLPAPLRPIKTDILLSGWEGMKAQASRACALYKILLEAGMSVCLCVCLCLCLCVCVCGGDGGNRLSMEEKTSSFNCFHSLFNSTDITDMGIQPQKYKRP